MCKHLKDTAVNLTHSYTNGGSPEITSTVPLIMNSMLSLLPKHKEFILPWKDSKTGLSFAKYIIHPFKLVR